MQKLTSAKTMHGCFLAPAPKHISVKRDEGDSSETEEETDEDDSDYNFELGDQHLSSRGSDKMSVNCRRPKKTTGRVLALIFCASGQSTCPSVHVTVCLSVTKLVNMIF